MDMKPVKIGGELFWSNWMNQYNTKFNEDNKKYACTLGKLSEAAAEALQQVDIRIKDKELPGKHIVGKSLFPFAVVDKDGNEVPIENIGNGSKVIALITPYRHKMSAKWGASPSIKKLILTELVEYNPSRSIEEEDLVL